MLSHHFSLKIHSGVAHTVVAARENVVPGGKSTRLHCSVNGGYLRDEVDQEIIMGICNANRIKPFKGVQHSNHLVVFDHPSSQVVVLYLRMS